MGMRDKRRGRGPRAARGFTLMELGVVLAVAAILAAAVVPDVIEAARNRMAEKAAHDVTVIQDAAKWYYVESAPAHEPWNAWWPGERDGANAPAAGTCAALGSTSPKGELTLTSGADPKLCALAITTLLPTKVEKVFTSLLPVATCTGCPGGAPPANFTRCCSRIPKPGGEASIKYAIDDMKFNWIPTNVYAGPDPTAPGSSLGCDPTAVFGLCAAAGSVPQCGALASQTCTLKGLVAVVNHQATLSGGSDPHSFQASYSGPGYRCFTAADCTTGPLKFYADVPK